MMEIAKTSVEWQLRTGELTDSGHWVYGTLCSSFDLIQPIPVGFQVEVLPGTFMEVYEIRVRPPCHFTVVGISKKDYDWDDLRMPQPPERRHDWVSFHRTLEEIKRRKAKEEDRYEKAKAKCSEGRTEYADRYARLWAELKSAGWTTK